MAGMDSSYRLEKVTPLLETSRTTPSENFRVYLVLRNNCFWRKRKKSYRLNFGKSQKCGILSHFIITKKLPGFVSKNVHGFVFMFPNNPQNLNPGHTATL